MATPSRRSCATVLLLVWALKSWSHVAAAATETELEKDRDERDFAVVAYLPEWRYASANFEVICRHVSHLVFFSLEVGTGRRAIEALDRLPSATVLAEAQRMARRHGTRLLACFGGNGRSAGFSRMVRKPKLRAGFAKSVKKLLDAHGLDGVDLNWEYPGYDMGRGYLGQADVSADYEGLHALCRELRETLGSDKAITLAYYPDSRQEALLSGARPHVDLMHSMAYDAPGRGGHSPVALATQALTQAAAFQSKHALGLPFYGRDASSWVTYEDLVQRHWPLDPSLDVVENVGFNGVDTIEAKVKLALDAGAAGVMIWEVGQDCRLEPVVRDGKTHTSTCPDPSASLLLAISRALVATESSNRRRRQRATWYPTTTANTPPPSPNTPASSSKETSQEL